MGGDHAPDNVVEGVLAALADGPASCEILLVGRTADVAAALDRHGGASSRIRIVEAPDVIGMAERPMVAIRGKRASSVTVGVGLQKKGEADAFISAGNTGAVMAASRVLMGLYPGVERPAIGAVMPTVGKTVLFLDAGANIDCSPRELRGFAHLGAVYARDVLGRTQPTVGLLSIGEEEAKGNAAVKQAHQLLKTETVPFTFLGNVEGRDILDGHIDVVVCDGFVGNVVLKFYESVARLFTTLIEREMEESVLTSLAMERVFTKLDYSTYGGAPLLGGRGVCIICHGRSSARAIKNAIGVALRAVESHLSQHIEADIADRGAVA